MSQASAATPTTFNVTTTDDAHTSGSNDGNAANCPGPACSLRDAITAVQADSNSDPTNSDNTTDVINVPAGHYVITGGDDLPVITHNVRIVGTDPGGARTTTIDGTDSTSTSCCPVSHVLHIDVSNSAPVSQQAATPFAPPTVQISGLKITGGADYDDDLGGGGILVDNSVLNSYSAKNKVTMLAGPTVDLRDSEVVNNVAAYVGHGGGGVLALYGTTVTMERDSIVSNSALAYEYSAGGGIFNSGAMTITDSTVAENSTNCASGMMAACSALPINLPIVDGGDGGPGGGIFEDASDFSGNTQTLTLKNDTISNNVGTDHGGGLAVAVFDTYGCGPSVLGCIGLSKSGGPFKAINTGGQFIPPVTVQNTILSRNSALAFFNSPSEANYQDCFSDSYNDYAAGIDDLGNNLDYDQQNSCGFSSAARNDLVSTDPGLPTALKLNGGNTHSYGVPASSPVVDAGDNGTCANNPGLSGPSDQEGAARISGAACDMGAIEYQFPTAQAAAGPPQTPAAPKTACAASKPRSSISRNGFLLTGGHLRLVGRTVDFKCLGLTTPGGVKRVRVAIARIQGSHCQFLNSHGKLGSSRSCKKPALLKAKLGQLRDGKVPWTYSKLGLNLPAGRYLIEAFAIDNDGNKETALHVYNQLKRSLK